MMVSLLHPKLYLKSKIRNKWWRTKIRLFLLWCDLRHSFEPSQCWHAYGAFCFRLSYKCQSNQAFIEVAHYYFDQGNYTQALQWFEKVNESQWVSDRDKFNFKRISFFNSKNKKKQPLILIRLLSRVRLANQILFGLYGREMMIIRKPNFLMPFLVKKNTKKLSYYQADMNFKLGEFQKQLS
jgi:hypothetical protein